MSYGRDSWRWNPWSKMVEYIPPCETDSLYCYDCGTYHRDGTTGQVCPKDRVKEDENI